MSAEFASADLTAGQLNALVKKVGGKDAVLGILRGTVELVTKVTSFITHTFTILVDETKSVEEAVEAWKFDWTNTDITSENFPQPKDGKKLEKEVTLFHFKEKISSEGAIRKMDEAGYKPGTIWDLLGLALKEPNLQKEFPIVALGSVGGKGGSRSVPSLDWDDRRRCLGLYWFGFDWDGSCRFVGVRK